jgi:rRNA processing protein Krr1/Pno1
MDIKIAETQVKLEDDSVKTEIKDWMACKTEDKPKVEDTENLVQAVGRSMRTADKAIDIIDLTMDD